MKIKGIYEWIMLLTGVPMFLIAIYLLFGYEEFPEEHPLRWVFLSLGVIIGISLFIEHFLEPLIKNPKETLIKQWKVVLLIIGLIWLFFFS